MDDDVDIKASAIDSLRYELQNQKSSFQENCSKS